MINRFLKLFKAPRPADADAPTPRIVFTDAALAALRRYLTNAMPAAFLGICRARTATKTWSRPERASRSERYPDCV